MIKKRVLVAMSGGVDSALSAALLIDKGYQVEGLTLLLFDSAIDMIEEAKACALALNIVHFVLDLRDVFKESVVEPFAQSYLNGETPNPCMICNQRIKYGYMFDEMNKRGFDYLATGHYGRICYNEKDQNWHLLKGKAVRKDQSYFLYHLKPEQMEKLLLPLGEYATKEAVREAASMRGLATASKKDSDGICFLDGMAYADFLMDKFGQKKGLFLDTEGNIMGFHDGFYHFTIGQKKGLPLHARTNKIVTKINAMENEVIIGCEEDIYERVLWLCGLHLHKGIQMPFKADIKIFNWGYYLKGQVFEEQGQIKVVFDEPVRAIAKGQYAVFYLGDRVIGGGKIVSSQKN